MAFFLPFLAASAFGAAFATVYHWSYGSTRPPIPAAATSSSAPRPLSSAAGQDALNLLHIEIDKTEVLKVDEIKHAFKKAVDEHIITIGRRSDRPSSYHQKILNSITYLCGWNSDSECSEVEKNLGFMADAGVVNKKDGYHGFTMKDEKDFEARLDNFFNLVKAVVKSGLGGFGVGLDDVLTTVCESLKIECRQKIESQGQKWKSVKVLVKDGENMRVLMCAMRRSTRVKATKKDFALFESTTNETIDETEMFVVSCEVIQDMWDESWQAELENQIFTALVELESMADKVAIRARLQTLRNAVEKLVKSHQNEQKEASSGGGSKKEA